MSKYEKLFDELIPYLLEYDRIRPSDRLKELIEVLRTDVKFISNNKNGQNKHRNSNSPK